MAKLAFCGLGQMGGPTAHRLLEAGHDVVVWNRTPDRAQPLVEQGAHSAGTPAEAAASAEAVLTMLSTPSAVEDVVFGEAGLAQGMEPGATLVEMSTIGPAVVRRIAGRLPHGVDMIDAPVLGSVPQATQGTLKVFVGGSAELFDRWRPVFEDLGTPTHLGPLGAGASMKLVANSVLGAVMTALGEALALADAHGLDESTVLDLLADSPIGATVKSKRDKIESGTYPPNFKLALAAKDMALVDQAAERERAELRLARAAQDWFEAADSAGLGSLDYSAVIAHVRGRKATGGDE